MVIIDTKMPYRNVKYPKGFIGPKLPQNYTVSKVVRQPKNLGELKFYDTGSGFFSLNQGTASQRITTLNLVAIGTGEQQRVGRKIRVVSLEIHVEYGVVNPAGSLLGDYVKMDVWLDKQCNGVAAVAGDLYTGLSGVTGPGNFPYLPNEKRFKLLSSKSTNMLQDDSGYTNLFIASVKLKLNHVIEFKGTTGTITDVASNNLSVAWSCAEGQVQCRSFSSRIRYYDT